MPPEKRIRGGIGIVIVDRHLVSVGNKKIFYFDDNNLYGYAMSQSLPNDVTENWKGHPDCFLIRSEDIIKTPKDSDIGYFVEVDLKYPDEIKKI